MSFKSLLRTILAAGGSSGGAPTPTLTLDFTSTLPSQVTFSRTGSRTAIVGGQLTTIGSGVPAIESWDGINRGLSLEPASTNVILQSNTFNTTWIAEQATVASGVPGPDGNATSAWSVAEDTSTNYHGLRQTVNSINSGTMTCVSAFFAQKSGASRWGAAIRQALDFSNVGARSFTLLNGKLGQFAYDDSGYTGHPTCGVQRLANGWYRAWVTAVTNTTGNKRFGPRAINQDFNGNIESYAGSITEGFNVYGFQVEHNVSAPTSYKTTTTASASSGAESAVISGANLAFLDTTKGTFIIEHDCTSGVLLGSGTNTVISGTTPLVKGSVFTKTAFAYDGTGSDLVNNGGATTSGGVPTFGSDLRLLGTSTLQNVGHIKSLTYYPQRLTVAQMQALTGKASTANPGTWRLAAERSKLANAVQPISGTTPAFLSRVPVKIGSGNLLKLRFDFSNAYGADAPIVSNIIGSEGKVNTGNPVVIDSITLERVTGVNECVPVTFSGLRSITLADGALNVTCDDILPSSFTSMPQFNQSDQFFAKIKGHLTSPGNIPVGRWSSETNTQGIYYDASVTTYSSTDATGPFTLVSGTVGTTSAKVFAPVAIGVFASGDPVTVLYPADSLGEGVSAGTVSGGSWVVKSTQNLHLACLESDKGGQGITMLSRNSLVQAYMKYARVMVVEYGTNNQNSMMDYLQAYATARTNGIGLIAQCSMLANTSSTDSFATEANQTATRSYPANPEQVGVSLALMGWIDSYYKLTSTRGVNPDKWLTNGTAQYATGDGTHPTDVGDNLLATEYQPVLAAAVAALV